MRFVPGIPGMDDDDALALMHQAAAGDVAAVQLLLVRYHPNLISHIQNRIGSDLADEMSAEDVCQEAYVSAFRAIANFRPTPEGGFYTWLRTIAEHKLTDACRAARAAKRGKRQRVVGPAGADATSMVALLECLAVDEKTPSQSAARHELVAAVQSTLQKLSSEYRDVLRLRYVERLSVEETAARMDRSEGSVRMLCVRALEQLAVRIGNVSRFLSR